MSQTLTGAVRDGASLRVVADDGRRASRGGRRHPAAPAPTGYQPRPTRHDPSTPSRTSPDATSRAGQALQRIVLTASACGSAVAMHSQPLELPWLRRVIRLQFSDGAYPHLILRFGNVAQVAVSTRREVANVLTVPADPDDS